MCRVLDYSKYKYEQSQKQKAARKHQQQITIREIKFRPKIAEQDYATKKRHVERFLKHKDKVKITIMFSNWHCACRPATVASCSVHLATR